jgi:hypothetical protein
MLGRFVDAVRRDWEGERPRPAPHDRIVMHGGDNRWMMMAALLVLFKCAAVVALLLLGVPLWPLATLLVIVAACIGGLELAGGVQR